MGAKQHYAIALKIMRVEDGKTYAAAAKIYKQTTAELLTVASLFLDAGSKFKAATIAVGQLLEEIPDGSSVSISGLNFGKESRRYLKKSNIADVIKRKRLSVYMNNSLLVLDRPELFELAKDAAKRHSSIIVDI